MTTSLNGACKFLESLRRFDLSKLLGACAFKIERVEGDSVDGDWYPSLTDEVITVEAPAPVDEALKALPPYDRKRVAEAIASTRPDGKTFSDIEVRNNWNTVAGSIALLAELIIHRGMVIDVATGRAMIQDVNDYYIAREGRIREALPPDIEYENPHPELWAWFKFYKEHLGGYADRRQYVTQMFTPAIQSLSTREVVQVAEREPTGWNRVDRALATARAQFAKAAVEEEFQVVGLLCREIIISLAQAVFDPVIHQTVDGVAASKTDANRMLEAYVAHLFPGETYKELRAHHRASLGLALNLQHRRTATKQLAALCLEATSSTVAVVSILARPEDGE